MTGHCRGDADGRPKPYTPLLPLVVSAVLLLIGCNSPTAEFDSTAELLGLEKRLATGTRFQHVVYHAPGLPTKTLHVYLDGDGTPWFAGLPAVDPTPRDALGLRLLAMDPAPAVYVGRPCYHGAAAVEPCNSRLWTTHRYSEEVVLSLAAVVRQLMSDYGAQEVAWFGYSGGGTLAVLLARHFETSVSVVTVAANLDTSAWAAYLWGGDLPGSLNPASGAPLAFGIRQRHYAGAEDDVVPPELATRAAAHLGADLIVVDGYDHVCCWERLWPAILREVAEASASPKMFGPLLGRNRAAVSVPAHGPHQVIDRPTVPP
jgi:pimeloyl-ACP methyl ester carboxylesterase